MTMQTKKMSLSEITDSANLLLKVT